MAPARKWSNQRDRWLYAEQLVTLLHLLPSWNSIEAIRSAHSYCEIVSIGFFGLTALCEAVSHFREEHSKSKVAETYAIWFFVVAVLLEASAYVYGQRNDTLSESMITSLSVKSEAAVRNAALSLSRSKAALQQIDAANSHAEALETKLGGLGDLLREVGSAEKKTSDQQTQLTEELQITSAHVTELKPRFISLPEEDRRSLFSMIMSSHRPRVTILRQASKPNTDQLASSIRDALGSIAPGIYATEKPDLVESQFASGVHIWYLPSGRALAMIIDHGISQAGEHPETRQITNNKNPYLPDVVILIGVRN